MRIFTSEWNLFWQRRWPPHHLSISQHKRKTKNQILKLRSLACQNDKPVSLSVIPCQLQVDDKPVGFQAPTQTWNQIDLKRCFNERNTSNSKETQYVQPMHFLSFFAKKFLSSGVSKNKKIQLPPYFKLKKPVSVQVEESFVSTKSSNKQKNFAPKTVSSFKKFLIEFLLHFCTKRFYCLLRRNSKYFFSVLN